MPLDQSAIPVTALETRKHILRVSPSTNPPSILAFHAWETMRLHGFFMLKVSRVSCYRDDPIPNRVTVSFRTL